MALTLQKKRHHGATIVTAEGGVSLHTSPQLRELIENAIQEWDDSPQLVVDFTGVEFCDSAGLGVLVTTYKRVQHRGGRFVLVCPPGPVLRLLRISGLDTVFPVHSRLDEAVSGTLDAEP